MMRALVGVMLLSLVASATASDTPALRVCADPNNLPFSDRAGGGLEDALARLVAESLHWHVEHVFWPQRRGFLRNTLKAGKCDVVMGVPHDLEGVATTRPYYRSTYVFVTRSSVTPGLHSLADPRLRTMRIGVPVVGDDYANPPPVHALSRRGIVDNVRGFSVFGDYRRASPPLELIRAVSDGRIDVALAWGPLAGFVARQDQALRLAPITPSHDGPYPFVFDIAMGVREGDQELRRQLDSVLQAERARVKELLHAYGVPLL
jgi:mxaJ protein